MSFRGLAFLSPLLLAAACAGSKAPGASIALPPPAGLHWTVPGFVIAPGTEGYQCFYFHQRTGGTASKPRGAVKFSYAPDSTAVHHVVVFTSTNNEPHDTTQPCQFLFADGWNFRYAGGKATGPLVVPAGTAVPLAPEEVWVFQFHFLNASTAPITDHSAIDIEFADPEASFTHASLLLLGKKGFSIPSTGSPVEVVGTCDVPVGTPPMKIFGLWPHMHQIGTHFKVDITHAGVSTTPIDEAWNFGDQTLWTYPGASEINFGAGDSIRTTCTYVNSTGQAVAFGELSEQEMCFNFVYYYPATLVQSLPCGL